MSQFVEWTKGNSSKSIKVKVCDGWRLVKTGRPLPKG